MKEIKTVDAIGHVLCHDLTQILPGKCKDARFRKGHIVVAEDIPVLLSMGKENLYVWQAQKGMIHEDDAAKILYEICAGEHMRASNVKEGKVEILAEIDGFFQINNEKMQKINSIGEIMIASRHSGTPAKKNDKLAGTRVIPLIVSNEKLKLAKSIAGEDPLLSITPYQHKKIAIITTGNEVAKGLVLDKFTPVIRKKLGEFSTEEIGHIVLDDNPKKITKAILDFIEKGADFVICTGGMSVDPDDKTPLAIKHTGANIVSYGAPVLPGAMFMLAYYQNSIPIIGLPGCVMYAGRTIFDIALPRIMANIKITQGFLSSLGNGGLCLNCNTCIFPNCGFGIV